MKAFANGYWEPVVSIDALSSSSYGGVALQARGRSAYSYAAQISNVTGSSGLLVSAQSGGTALYVSGNASISGTLYASVKNFQIDHPQHPDTQYLRHSVVESDGYKVQYDGNVLLNGAGEATVSVPGYVELVAGDFRYQLTTIGGPASVYIATELAGNQFKIAGGKAGMKVSWQLTGIRKDPAALADPLVVEAPKPSSIVGTYMRPELYGRPSSESEANVGAVDRVAPATNSGKTLGAAQLTPPLLPQGNY